MTPIETIREALEHYKSGPNIHSQRRAINALAALTALRDDPNRVPVELVPEGWQFEFVYRSSGNEFKAAISYKLRRVFGFGSTIAAAVRAACERAREG